MSAAFATHRIGLGEERPSRRLIALALVGALFEGLRLVRIEVLLSTRCSLLGTLSSTHRIRSRLLGCIGNLHCVVSCSLRLSTDS